MMSSHMFMRVYQAEGNNADIEPRLV
jgi:hypothetical protein